MARSNVRENIQKRLKCSVCGNTMYVWRNALRNKKAGHIKHMWCPVCQDETGHIELSENPLLDEIIIEKAKANIPPKNPT